jgi:hypothetical protein
MKILDCVYGHNIRNEITSWPNVTAEPHRFGGIEFRLSKREMGHIHGDRLADMPFPMKTRNELVNSGRVKPHRHATVRLGQLLD